ncbi:MAG: hypothetical protein MMC33_001310 [Icmadophila ericetorum]|nr:hypothetical protein [Icmadophila ericetorum]
MASNHASLDAAATERKARLAKLKSLKRKQPGDDEPVTAPISEPPQAGQQEEPSVTTTYLSGRNYDPSTRGPKLGFETAPSENAETLENRAAEIALETHKQAEEEEKTDRPIDLFKLQPKKPNWDLKRDLQKKMEVLNVQTENAIARLVRERIEGQKKKQVERAVVVDTKMVGAEDDGGGGEDVGMRGDELVEGVHLREKEEEEDEKREREEEEGME